MRLFLYALIAVFLLLPAGCGNSKNRVVVYCALDREFAEEILKEFTQKSGLEVVPRWDTEANKSVGLYEDIVREAGRPRCDVHWNNEILGTIRLHKRGLLAPYESPSAAAFPAAFKAIDHTWTAFAARARVFLINTAMAPDPKDWPMGLRDLTTPRWKGRFAMARPIFGTTATNAACLFQVLGDNNGRALFRQLRENDAQVLPGNKQVAVAVGNGQVPVGWTDTDDAFAELDAGNPVAMVFPDHAPSKDNDLGALFIPNTVAMIKNCPNPEGAKKLIDFLLSPEVEAKLAKAKSRQIPINPNVIVKLPRQVLTPAQCQLLPVDFAEAAQLWEETQKFMVKEFALK